MLNRVGFLGAGMSRGVGGFAPLSTAPTAWYDPSDLSTLWQDTAGTTPVTAHGQSVARINDKSGNGFHLTQGTAALRPLYQSDASGKYLLFDGVDDYLLTGSAVVTSFPFERISAIQQVTWVNSDRIFCHGSGTCALLQRPTSPNITINDGLGDVVVRSATVGQNFVVTERHISGAQQLALDNGAYATGNAGTTAPLTQFFIGARSEGTAASNIRFYGAALKSGSWTDGQIAAWRTLLGSRCGLVL